MMVPPHCVNEAPIADYPCTAYQSIMAAITVSATSTLSILSSLATIFVIKRSQLKLTSIYHRIMFGMSTMDIFGSLAMGLNVIPMPTDMVYAYPFSYGTFTTCQIQGFVYLFGITGSGVYVSGLCFYYYCILKKEIKDEKLKSLEPIIHIGTFVMSITFSVSTRRGVQNVISFTILVLVLIVTHDERIFFVTVVFFSYRPHVWP